LLDTGEQKAAAEKSGPGRPLSILPVISLRNKPAGKLKPADRPYRPPLWHQFRVLTARYAELMWGDRRSFRLLFLQAPIVALVILLGFFNKPYDDGLPVPRELDEAEHKALLAVNTLMQAGRIDRDLTAVEREALKRVHVPVKGRRAVNALQGF